MTAATLPADAPIYATGDPDLISWLQTHPAVSAMHALQPVYPLGPRAQAMYDVFLNSSPGRQASRSLLALDGTAHTELAVPCKAANEAWMMLTRYHATVQAASTRFAAYVGGADQSVNLAKYAWQVPLTVMLDAVGLHDADPALIHELARRNTDFIWSPISDDEQCEALRASAWLFGIVWTLVQNRVSAPREDITSQLLASGLSPDKVAGLVFGAYVIAGHEASSHQITNVVRVLLERDEWKHVAFAPRPGAASKWIRSAMRFRPGIHALWRTATADIETPDGTIVPAGSRIQMSIQHAAAKDPNPKWVFGGPSDPHACIGMPMAVGTIDRTVWDLARTWPDATLPEQDIEPYASAFFAGPSELLVQLHP